MKKLNCTFRTYRVLILFLLLITSNSFSQGPVAPEAGAFEPVDAPDMVNLKTGDMTYTIPVINIPGSSNHRLSLLANHQEVC